MSYIAASARAELRSGPPAFNPTAASRTVHRRAWPKAKGPVPKVATGTRRRPLRVMLVKAQPLPCPLTQDVVLFETQIDISPEDREDAIRRILTTHVQSDESYCDTQVCIHPLSYGLKYRS